MKIIFDKTIWDVNDLLEIFSVSKIKRFLKKQYALSGKSVAYDLEVIRTKIGDYVLIEEVFSFFYPQKLIIIEDLYAICLQVSPLNPRFSRFVPYNVKVVSDKKKTRKSIRLKNKKVAFAGGFGKYSKTDINKIMKEVGFQKVPISQAEVIIVASIPKQKKQKEQLSKSKVNTVEIDYIEDRFDKVLKKGK